MQPLERRRPLYETVGEEIKRHIVQEGLRPGDALEPEGKIAERLGVSRVSVREAIKSLSSLGILESQQGSGVFVREFSFDALLDNLPYGLLRDLEKLSEILEIRCVLEKGLVGKAIARLTEERLAALRATLAEMEAKAGAGESISDTDRDFHRQLFADLGNATVLKLLDIFWLAFNKAAQQVAITTPNPRKTYRDHAAIVEAVAAGDAAGAQEALRNHYADILGRLERTQAALHSERTE